MLGLTRSGGHFTPIGEIVDERCIVNAMVALLATGGSTNHLIHWVAVARSAGVLINWTDFSDLSGVVPLLARVYPNGSADVNHFQAAGGPAFIIRELIDAGYMHGDVLTVANDNLRAYTRNPVLEDGNLVWKIFPPGPRKTRSCVQRTIHSVRPVACVYWQATWDAL